MPTRAACAGREVPARVPPRRSATARRCSPATSFRPTMPRTHWTPSPCGRLSRPPRWRVTATTTTGPPPRPGGNSGRCACPEPTNSGSAGTAGTLPTFTHRPVGRVGAQLYPGGIAARYRNTARGLVRPISNQTNETVPNDNRDRAPQQPIAASFRGCCPVSGLQALVCLLRLSALLPHPARWRQTVARSSGAAPALRRTSGLRLPHSFSRPLRRPGARPLTPPGHMAPRGALLSLWKRRSLAPCRASCRCGRRLSHKAPPSSLDPF
jgi:hypothetical protein